MGPNRVGYGGLLQPVADGVKNFMKEETYPGAANMPLFILAPALAFIPALRHLGGDPVRVRRGTRAWGTIDMVARAAADRLPVHPRHRVARRVRHRARRLVVEQQVRAARRPPLERADDLVRDRDGHVARSRCCCWPATSSLEPDRAAAGVRDGWNVLNLTIAFFIFLVAAFAETNRAAVRPAGGGVGARRRLPHRVQRDEVLDVLHRRVREHDHGERADGDAVLRRLGHPVHAVGQPRRRTRGSRRSLTLLVLRGQGDCSSCSSSCGSAGRCRASATTS